MYVKLALRNMKRSARDYLIYVVTLILCVGMFYAFVSTSSPYYSASLPVDANLDFFNKYMKYATFFISSVLIFLIKYVNNSMITRKKKEFAIQTMMGMEQKTTAYLFFWELLCIGLVAIGVGVMLGVLLSQVITAIILDYFEQTYRISLLIFPDTVLITLAFFIVAFCIIGLLNIRTIRKIKVIDMLNDGKKTENLKTGNPIFITIIGVLTVISLVLCIYLILSGIVTNYLMSVPFLVFSIYGFYHCLSGILLFIKSKFVKIKYKKENLFLFGQITSKLKTASKTMTTITLTLMGAMIALVLAAVLSSWAMEYLNLRAVFDIQLFSQYYRGGNVKTLTDVNPTDINYNFVIDYLKEEDHEIDSYVQTELYLMDSIVPIFGISLSDYNQIRKMTGLPEIVLAENEFTTQWYKTTPQDEILAMLNDRKTLQVENAVLYLSDDRYYKDSFGEVLYTVESDFIYVLPDMVCKGLTVAQINFYVNTTEKLNFAFANELQNYVTGYIDSNEDLTENRVDFRIKTLQYNEGITGSLMSLFLLVYGGVVLIVMCFTVLSVQQLSDSEEHKYRFNVLKKIGADNSVINKILVKQMGVWFGIPVIIAFIGSGIILNFIFNSFSEPVLAFIGINGIWLNIAATCAIVIIILACYFISTWIMFRRNINRNNGKT